jgi:hypothetical protein
MRRSATLLLLCPLALGSGHVPSDDPFNPDAPAHGEIRGDGVNYGVLDRPSASPAGTEPAAAAPDCSYEPVSDDFQRERVIHEDRLVPRGAIFFYRRCADSRQLDWYVPTEEPAEREELASLVAEAFDRVEPPAPRLVTSPPVGSEVLTGMPMYLAVDDVAFGEFSGSVSAGQFTVTARVRPVSSWFSPGDQHGPRVCEGFGSVWSAGQRPSEEDCTHTFTHTPVHLHGEGETFGLSARVTYEASYTVSGPILAGSYELGTFEGPETVVEVAVVERRAVRTTAGG